MESLRMVCGDLPKEVIDSIKVVSFKNTVLTPGCILLGKFRAYDTV